MALDSRNTLRIAVGLVLTAGLFGSAGCEDQATRFNNAGLTAYYAGRHQEALAAFEEALKDRTYPSPEKILYNLGTLHLEAKRYPEALDAFQRAVAANTNYAKGYYGLGLIYAETGKGEDARTNFRKVIALEPKSPEAGKAREYLAQKAAPTKG